MKFDNLAPVYLIVKHINYEDYRKRRKVQRTVGLNSNVYQCNYHIFSIFTIAVLQRGKEMTFFVLSASAF